MNRIALLLTLIVGVYLAPRAIAADKPNVLFIAIDDLNDWVGPLGGHPQVKTPNMDRLAARGVTFTNAHCQAPLCNPSRTSILTGLRPSTTGVYSLGTWFRKNDKYKDWVTLPQHFMANGYAALTTGKVYHDAFPPKADRADGKEFTEFGYHGSFGPRPKKPYVPETGHPMVDWGVFPERDDEQEDYKVADWAIAHIKDRPKDKPLFLSVGFRHPHVPLYASQKWFDMYPLETLQLPPMLEHDRDDTPRFSWYLHWHLPEPRLKWLQERGQLEPMIRGYLASVSFVDSQVGRVLDALDAAGLTDNTVIVMWSDHGYHLGEKEISGKNTLWRESTRVPLIFAGPGVAQKGVKCDQPAELLDVFPTLIDLCGLTAHADLDGHSLMPQLKDATAARPWPAICTQGPGNHVIVTDRWRYIRYADGSQELYDRTADPREWRNIADDPKYASTITELAAQLPKDDTAPLPGNKTRLIEIVDGLPHWEGEPIHPNDPIPSKFK
ncbi:MAG: sulfatase-like hydrolase/transferase [Phycisphaera sp.]|nr:sulfatase-like hydrolase/transferase [Phycisphaera sp.]